MCWVSEREMEMDLVLWLQDTDAVFPMETDLTLKKEGERYSCPGIGDDTRAVAELLSLARAMNAVESVAREILFVQMCEEDLVICGEKHVFRC